MTVRSIINKGRSAAETHRERKLGRNIKFQAHIAATCVEYATRTPVPFSIGPTPGNISDQEYRDRVGTEALVRLKELNILDRMIVSYGEEASRERTERLADEYQHIVFDMVRDPLPDLGLSESHSFEGF